MNAVNMRKYLAGRMGWLTVVLALLRPALPTQGAIEQTFDVLQIGTHTYRNVTVTTKAKDYIFILHSAGMTNIRVKDLPAELRQQLGYVEKPAEAKGAASWFKKATGELEKRQLAPQLQALEQHLPGLGGDRSAMMALVTPKRLFIFLGGALAFYLFFCYCCAEICQKAGQPGGVLIWVPVLQLVPLLRAARMSGWWTVAFLLPVLNLVAQIVWSFKIAQARDKSPLLGFLLLLPVLNVLAFLYLAFSEATPAKEAPVVEIMTLDAA